MALLLSAVLTCLLLLSLLSSGYDNVDCLDDRQRRLLRRLPVSLVELSGVSLAFWLACEAVGSLYCVSRWPIFGLNCRLYPDSSSAYQQTLDSLESDLRRQNRRPSPPSFSKAAVLSTFNTAGHSLAWLTAAACKTLLPLLLSLRLAASLGGRVEFDGVSSSLRRLNCTSGHSQPPLLPELPRLTALTLQIGIYCGIVQLVIRAVSLQLPQYRLRLRCGPTLSIEAARLAGVLTCDSALLLLLLCEADAANLAVQLLNELQETAGDCVDKSGQEATMQGVAEEAAKEVDMLGIRQVWTVGKRSVRENRQPATDSSRQHPTAPDST